MNSAVRGLAWLPREERKRDEVSGVCRLPREPEEEEWRGREGAEFGGRPPPDMHSPLMCVCVSVHLSSLLPSQFTLSRTRH